MLYYLNDIFDTDHLKNSGFIINKNLFKLLEHSKSFALCSLNGSSEKKSRNDW